MFPFSQTCFNCAVAVAGSGARGGASVAYILSTLTPCLSSSVSCLAAAGDGGCAIWSTSSSGWWLLAAEAAGTWPPSVRGFDSSIADSSFVHHAGRGLLKGYNLLDPSWRSQCPAAWISHDISFRAATSIASAFSMRRLPRRISCMHDTTSSKGTKEGWIPHFPTGACTEALPQATL